MTEELICFLWESKLIPDKLVTTSGETIEVVHPGDRNSDSGPDFFNARIIIQNVTWAGNLEIHVNSSDWYQHNHQEDPAYDNILLHLVYNFDRPVFRSNGEEIPTVEIKNLVKQNYIDRYDYLVRNRKSISCEGMTNVFPKEKLENFLFTLCQERFNNKAELVRELSKYYTNDIQQLFYILLFRAFGMSTNALPFELLAKSVSFKILQRHADQLFILESLLFGQAGLLSGENSDPYYFMLKSEYKYLKKKYQLLPIDVHLWKFARTRPVNFPTVRIAQLAALLHQHPDVFHIIKSLEKVKEWIRSLEIRTSDYWNHHYRFDKSAKEHTAMIGTSMNNNLLINCIIPFLYYLSDFEEGFSQPLEILKELPPENNRQTRQFITAGIDPENALHSQALLELKKHYCDNKRCLDCQIGKYILYK